ncbi:enoyl-CoA hydratase/isomerase family protein [Paraglaciecola chathamensis]|uniref:Methylglutaconyl-CoA hydratase n=1 Tax=Paraglaciecola agarilytica NO2 TaxID=1125747 RepID=A0ABQ0I7K8_9ALTE|nr:enoyl-CoA hydratase/isomerase family protein [Paraglaciecola agarilytica]GAC05347.1 methylglutaconyl-CoA hydratase [Paraglaciecola agarilytica NO2]
MDNTTSQNDSAMSEHVISEVDERGVATVTLNRPEVHNAFDDVLINSLTQTFTRLGADDSIRAVILASKGKSFCAGADLNWMKRMAGYSYEQNLNDANALANMLHTLNTLPKPTIARVQGAAFGGAVGLVACCDMAIGSKMSKFCLSEVKLGLIPATISPYVIQAIGERNARRYFTTAEVFSSRRARRIGLLSESVTEEELDITIESLLEHILKNGPNAVTAAKQLIADVANRVPDDALRNMTSERIANTRVSSEGQEGLGAFLQKRRPNWYIS